MLRSILKKDNPICQDSYHMETKPQTTPQINQPTKKTLKLYTIDFPLYQATQVNRIIYIQARAEAWHVEGTFVLPLLDIRTESLLLFLVQQSI